MGPPALEITMKRIGLLCVGLLAACQQQETTTTQAALEAASGGPVAFALPVKDSELGGFEAKDAAYKRAHILPADVATTTNRLVAISAPTVCDTTQLVRSVEDRSACPDVATNPRIVAKIAGLDRFVSQERADARARGWSGALLARQMTPLTVGEQVYVDFKSGYTACADVAPGEPCSSSAWDSVTRQVRSYSWIGDQLSSEPDWVYLSSWVPPTRHLVEEWEPLFQPAIYGDFIYIPEANGRVAKVRRTDGVRVHLYDNPDGLDGFPQFDYRVSSPITAAPNGDIFYSAISTDPAAPTVIRDSWYLKGKNDGAGSLQLWPVRFNVSPPAGGCQGTFRDSVPVPALPWPPSPTATAPTIPCGPPMPALNSAPVVSSSGDTVYLVTRFSGAENHTYVHAVSPNTMIPRWTRAMHQMLRNGCSNTLNSLVGLSPITALDTAVFDDVNCRIGSQLERHRDTGTRGSYVANHRAMNQGVPTPDNGLAIGFDTRQDNRRGMLAVFRSTDGAIRAGFNSGFNRMATVVSRPAAEWALTFADNNYPNSPYQMTQWKINVGAILRNVQWTTRSTSKERCVLDNGIKTCNLVDPGDGNGPGQQNFWCWVALNDSGASSCDRQPRPWYGGAPFDFISRAPVTTSGNDVISTSSDGHLYKMDGITGAIENKIFVDSSFGAADEPITIDRRGRILTIKEGNLSVLSD
jgi:hypothetical protein